jgi:hypothetical protein
MQKCVDLRDDIVGNQQQGHVISHPNVATEAIL